MAIRTEELQAPEESNCRHCYAPIAWGYWRTRWVALEADPNPDGRFVLLADGVGLLPISLEEMASSTAEQRRTSPTADRRYREHQLFCGGRHPTRVLPDSLVRWATGDTRGSGQANTVVRRGPDAGEVLPASSNCDRCDRPVAWMFSVSDGRRVPLNPEPNPAGLLVVVRPGCVQTVGFGFGITDDRPRYTLHFLTCRAPPDRVRRSAAARLRRVNATKLREQAAAAWRASERGEAT